MHHRHVMVYFVRHSNRPVPDPIRWATGIHWEVYSIDRACTSMMTMMKMFLFALEVCCVDGRGSGRSLICFAITVFAKRQRISFHLD